MSWFPVDDALHSHPKARRAGDEAMGMWTRAGSYCMAYLTDGFVPDWWIKEQPRGAVKAKRLIEAAFWHRGEKDGESGCWFHDWKPECLKVNVLAAREKARQRKAKQRESQGLSRVTDGVSPASCLVPTQPNPTQPINPVETLDWGITLGDARGPRPQCSDHPKENAETNCRGCKRRREWDEQHAAQVQADELTLRRELKALADNCPVCHGTNWIPDTEPAVRCTHQEEAHA